MMMRVLILAAMAGILSACISSSTSTRRAADSNEVAARELYNLGAQYYRNGKWELARARLLRATELDPRNANAYSLLALTYDQLDNDRLAIESFEKAVRIEPNNFDVQNAYAIFLCGRKKFDEALVHFNRAINVRENDNAEIMMSNAGVCIAKKPDYALAEEYFRSALETRPAYGEALIQLAALKHQTGDGLSARAFLQRYLANNEASAPVLFLAVQIETGLGDDRAATDYSNQLLQDFPDSKEAAQLIRSGQVQQVQP
jgi:type IV pilus assembly protein PilF